jgi:hypothetical protein
VQVDKPQARAFSVFWRVKFADGSVPASGRARIDFMLSPKAYGGRLYFKVSYSDESAAV